MRELNILGQSDGDMRSIACLTMTESQSGVSLHPFIPTAESLARVAEWELDPEVAQYYYADPAHRPYTADAVNEKYYKEYHNAAIAGFEIVAPSGKPVGYTSLLDMGYLGDTASLGIMIGDKEAWGQGIGGTATLILMICAKNLGFTKMRARVMGDNERSLRIFKRFPYKITQNSSGLLYFDIDLKSWDPIEHGKMYIDVSR